MPLLLVAPLRPAVQMLCKASLRQSHQHGQCRFQQPMRRTPPRPPGPSHLALPWLAGTRATRAPTRGSSDHRQSFLQQSCLQQSCGGMAWLQWQMMPA